jgi:integrase
MSAGAVIVQANRLSICGNPFKTSQTRPRPTEDTREWGILPFASFTENLPERPGSQVNDERIVYVPAEDIERVIAACPDNDWRLVFALSRYAGIRFPSEAKDLKWSDVAWENSWFAHRPSPAIRSRQNTCIKPAKKRWTCRMTRKRNTLDRERTNRVSHGKNGRVGGHPAHNPAHALQAAVGRGREVPDDAPSPTTGPAGEPAAAGVDSGPVFE